MKFQSVFALIVALTTPMAVVSKPENDQIINEDQQVQEPTTSIEEPTTSVQEPVIPTEEPTNNDEKDCFSLRLGYPCCEDDEVAISDQYGDWGYIKEFINKNTVIVTGYCGIGGTSKDTEKNSEMFGDYPYCSGCESNYTDEDGNWYYNSNDESWCKVNEDKCKICEPVNGYECCNSISTLVSNIDDNGVYGIENDKSCLISTLPSFKLNNFGLSVVAIQDLMPTTEPGSHIYISFEYRTDLSNFKEKYEIEFLWLNGKSINTKDIIYQPQVKEFRIKPEECLQYNDIKMVIRDRETNQRYMDNYYVRLNKVH